MDKKVFIGGPFKALINPKTSKMTDHHKNVFLDLIKFFTDRGYKVHNAHERENWGENFWEPEECTQLDFKEICSSDIFIAFPGSPPSPGTHIELGWASSMGKKLILLLKKGEYYAHLVKGLHVLGNVHYVYYNDHADYMDELENLFPIKELEPI